jgi:hypothetical protein
MRIFMLAYASSDYSLKTASCESKHTVMYIIATPMNNYLCLSDTLLHADHGGMGICDCGRGRFSSQTIS